jgi:KDO2-lipid IV(A) lauroyltransferase
MNTQKRIRREIHHAVVRVLLHGVGVMPRRMAQELFALVGHIGHATLDRDRRRVQRHLALAFPELDERARRRLARRVFVELGRNATDVFRGLCRPPGECARLIATVEGERNLERACAGGRGAVVVTGHLGAWELLVAPFVQRGFRVCVIARPLRDPRYQRLIEDLRRRLGVEVVREGETPRALVRALRGGALVGVLIDQNRTSRGVWVELFGRPAWTPTGAAVLARLAGVPLVPMAIRRAGRRHRITIGEPIRVAPDEPGAILAVTAASVKVLEGWIRETPDQWVWMYDRWRGPRVVGARTVRGAARSPGRRPAETPVGTPRVTPGTASPVVPPTAVDVRPAGAVVPEVDD